MDSDLLCVIPARGGSKRIPRKNSREMAGKPLVVYSIEAAQATGLFDTVYVGTDDKEIAEVSRRYGATVPYLMPDEVCDDLQPSHAPAQHLATSLSEEEGETKQTVVLLQPTSPGRNAKDIYNGVERYREDDCDFVISITPIDPHYFHWAMKENESGFWEMHFGDEYLEERPLLPDRYRPNGSIKIADIQALRETGHFFGEQCCAIETPQRRSIHVGTEFEWELAEGLLRNQREHSENDG